MTTHRSLTALRALNAKLVREDNPDKTPEEPPETSDWGLVTQLKSCGCTYCQDVLKQPHLTPSALKTTTLSAAGIVSDTFILNNNGLMLNNVIIDEISQFNE